MKYILGTIVLATLLAGISIKFPWWQNNDVSEVVYVVEYPQPITIQGLERTAIIGLSPEIETHLVGDIFAVQVYIDSSRMSANAMETIIQFPVDRLRVTDISKENSILTLWPVEPTYSNTEGTVEFAGGLQTPGFLGNFGRIMTIRFEVIGEGVSIVEFTSGALLANNGFGTDILQEMRHAIYTTKIADKRRGDLNDDGSVNFQDLSIVLANRGKDPAENKGDTNGDRVINFQDVSIVLANWSR